MKKIGCALIAAIFLAAVLLVASAKFLDVQIAKDWYENAVSFVGRFGLTPSWRLAGARSFAEDSYTGSYEADCAGQNGEESVFGGTSTKEHKVCIEGSIRPGSGNAMLILETGGASREILPGEDGKICETVVLTGSSRVKLRYQNFTGAVHLEVKEATAK